MIFIFILLWAIAIAMYVNGKRVLSLFLFFFFLFDAFQLIPEDVIGLKSREFALAYIIVIFIYGLFKYKSFIPRNKISILLLSYGAFLLFEFALSVFYYGIPLIEVIKTGRQNLLLLSYFIFRRLDSDEIKLLLKLLFCVVLFQCILFIIQAIAGVGLMIGYKNGGFKSGFLYRYYNLPLLLFFFVFYGIFSNPFKGQLKIYSMILPSITMFFPMHRSLSMVFIMVVALGISWKFGVFKSIKNVIVASAIGLLLLLYGSYNLSSRTISDINSVADADFLEVESVQLDSESTLLFRFAHFFERYEEVAQTNIGKFFGLGFMAEGSSYTNKHFNFFIGLQDPKTDETVQIETSDIAWSMLIVRYGIIGIVIYLLFYFSFILFSIQKKNFIYSIPLVCYLILIFSVSFTSDQLYEIKYLMLPLLLL